MTRNMNPGHQERPSDGADLVEGADRAGGADLVEGADGAGGADLVVDLDLDEADLVLIKAVF